MKARDPSPLGSSMRARHASTSARLVIVPAAKPSAHCSIVCMFSGTYTQWPLFRRCIVDRDETATLELLRDRIERIGLAQDFRSVVLRVLHRPIPQPLRTRIVPIAARVG